MLDNIEKPYWHDDLKSIYENGSEKECNGTIENEDILKENKYIKDAIVDGEKDLVITSEGHRAYEKFRDQQLDYAKVNVAQSVALLVGIIGALASLIIAFPGGAMWLAGAAALILFVTGIIIQIELGRVE
ncbi:hypothetical protein [Natrononativus amylolyticus]|uniref:hypothetical protein n=1 Tax=Natrononativus amylolyticus TaxID=2963434 RepID=UPI0020CCCBEC|nr:hypothetical protein [Natrononativus amylolyticus]